MDYRDEDKKNLISDWYKAQDPEVRAAFDVTVNSLSITRHIEQWEAAEQAKRLDGQHAGLCEVRFSLEKTKLRPLRRFRPVGFISIFPMEHARGQFSEGEFVFLLGCEKSGRIYIPNNAFDIALDLQRLYLHEGKGSIYEHDI